MNDSFPHISLETTRLYFPHQPFQRIDSLDTIIICRRVFIERQDILGILVLDLLKRSEFTLQGLLIPYRCSYLIIGDVILVNSNKSTSKLSILPIYTFFCRRKSSRKRYFQNAPCIKRTRAKQHTSQTNIHQIVFSQSFEELLTLDVISLHFIQEERLAKG